jgi:hypothetical protein
MYRLENYMANILVKLVTATFLGTTLAAVVNANPASAIQFLFSSDFTAREEFPGSFLIGTLAGEDLNMDEILQSTEVTNFFARFESNDEALFPSFTLEGTDVIAGTNSQFGFGSQSGNYDFATGLITATNVTKDFGKIDVRFGGTSGFSSLEVTCVDNPLPDKCTSLPFNEQGSFSTSGPRITLVSVPEPSMIGALTGFVVLSLGGLVKKKKLHSTGFNGSLLK